MISLLVKAVARVSGASIPDFGSSPSQKNSGRKMTTVFFILFTQTRCRRFQFQYRCIRCCPDRGYPPRASVPHSWSVRTISVYPIHDPRKWLLPRDKHRSAIRTSPRRPPRAACPRPDDNSWPKRCCGCHCWNDWWCTSMCRRHWLPCAAHGCNSKRFSLECSSSPSFINFLRDLTSFPRYVSII